MEIFVPRFRSNLPHINPHVLNAMFLKIDERDLQNVIRLWEGLDILQNVNIRKFFKTAAASACVYKTNKRALSPYLEREHITVHCGAKEGNELCRDLFHETMRETGAMVARSGYNLWYGGGDKGLMGAVLKGFLAARKECGFNNQFSVQVIPASFVKPDPISVNGMRPANEGLCKDTDIAIIMPDFMTRRELLDNKCAAAISGFGGTGTLDELTDILVHIKTGLRQAKVRVLNSYVPELGFGYYKNFKAQLDVSIKCGLESPEIYQHVKFVDTVAEAFADIDAHPLLPKRSMQVQGMATLRPVAA